MAWLLAQSLASAVACCCGVCLRQPQSERFSLRFRRVPTARSMSPVLGMDLTSLSSFRFRRPRRHLWHAPRPPRVAYRSCGPSSCACRCWTPNRSHGPRHFLLARVNQSLDIRAEPQPLARELRGTSDYTYGLEHAAAASLVGASISAGYWCPNKRLGCSASAKHDIMHIENRVGRDANNTSAAQGGQSQARGSDSCIRMCTHPLWRSARAGLYFQAGQGQQARRVAARK